MSGQTMTTHQVADLCEVDERTIRRWIAKASDKMPELSDKMSEADATKKPAHFHLNEVLAIINAGGKHTMAALLAENAKAPLGNHLPESGKLPAGVQLRELRLIYGPEEARRRVDLLIGYPSLGTRPPVPLLLEVRAPDAVGESAFARIRAELGDRAARRLSGAIGSIVGEAVAKKESDKKQGRLL